MGIKTNINASIGTVTFTAASGDFAIIHLARLHPDNRAYAALHGLKQKCGDAAALGMGTSDAAKLDAIRGVIAHLESGSADWNMRGGGADSAVFEALLAAGLVKDSPESRAKVRALTPAQRTALAMREDVKPHYDAILAERGKAVDTDELLAGL